MLTMVGTITVHVSDQDRALAFYTEKLHFEKRADMPMGPEQRWIEVAPPGAQTRILLYKPTPDAPGADSYEAAKAIGHKLRFSASCQGRICASRSRV